MRVAVDLNRCQGYAQCVFLAPMPFSCAERDPALQPQPGRCRAPARSARGRGLAILVEQLDKREAGEGA
jgi:hypothetical protein